MYSMFPVVEKSYKVKITEDIERDLRFLGQSRVDALTSPFAMKLLKEKNGVKLYELAEKEFYTMKAVTTVHAPIQEVMQILRMETTSQLREVMGEVFGTLFLDGVVLYKKPESTSRPHESLSVSWTALQASKPNLPHRDYVFLRYGDVFEKNLEHGSMYQNNGSGLYVGASIWESIELDGCEPLPPSQNVVRLRMRRSGIVVEETAHDGPLEISLFLSESHPGRDAVSTLTRTWMTKVVGCVAQIPNALLTRALGSQSLLTKRDFRKDGPNCYLCIKVFTVFRRKHHCRVCGDVVCSSCSEMKTLRQSSGNKEVRLCSQCRTASTTSILSSNSGSNSMSLSQTNGSQRSMPSITSSFDGYDNLEASNISLSGSTATLSESYSETARPKTHPLKSNGSFRRQRSTDSPVLNPANEFNRGGHSPVKEDFDTISEFSEFSEFHWTDEVTRPSVDDLAQLEKQLTVRTNTPFNYALSYSSRQEWPKAPIPMNEAARLKKVRELHLADPGKQFQEMCEYAAAELGCQIAAISFIGDKSGFMMAKVGLEKRELPRNMLMDAHAIMSTEPTVILDATEDLRFVNNPLVADGRVRFFAGFPMVTSDGHVVGSFSVADQFARELLPGDKFLFLRNLANVAIRGVEQNTLMSLAVRRDGGNLHKVKSTIQAPPPPGMNVAKAELTMQELLRTAYTTQCQVRMQVNPLSE
ncbi:1-phosphatidylinositol-3-phosphate 5-kinase FAB1A [Phytophthora citrophthora]|uniref:1-phosphatidylinositol-3-phosphate 5-kinase FAB1A n=1 Tax=Phytophthora citrophthora TaxID=4793 RepID=A0AAD9H0Y0_9STRA|nr:1-phosphatidylinositol-3-phosphate 5-kinase FAB1A [Phytophthora citrophthora]